MATSGSKNYAITRSEIVDSALSKIGEYDIGEAVSGDETVVANRALNLMVKAWAAKGIGIWLREEVILFLQKDQQKYVFQTDHHATTFVETTLSAAEASGQTVISVTSSAGMTAADNVGIKMDDGTIHWTTIVSVDSAVQITITTATDDDAASGNRVYAYTTKSDTPRRIKYAFRRDSSAQDTTVDLIGQDAYYALATKSSAGPVNQIWYQPLREVGHLFTWPVYDSSTDQLRLIADILPDDFDSNADNPDFPIEWGECLIYNLASRLATDFGIPRLERRELKLEAEYMLMEMLDHDVENASVIFGMA